jgi:hypothetical protein
MRDDLRGGAGPKLATYGQLKGPAQIFQKKNSKVWAYRNASLTY